MQHYVTVAAENCQDIDIQVEYYNAVDYVDRFYIGRVTAADKEGFWVMKFLHQKAKDGVLDFNWPERADIDTA